MNTSLQPTQTSLRLFIASIVWFVLVSYARGSSVEFPVSPTNLDSQGYTFSVSTNANKDGVAFQVTITGKQSDIYPDSSVNVDRVIEGSIGPATPAIPVVLKKEKRVWTANFTVSHELLKNPDFCFVFSEQAHRTVNGRMIAMPSVAFYEFRLQDFAKP